jgi:hypothetical protein
MTSIRAPLYPFSENSAMATCKIRSRVFSAEDIARTLPDRFLADTIVRLGSDFAPRITTSGTPNDEATIEARLSVSIASAAID